MDIEKLKSEAEAGSIVAQGVLGISYLYGNGVPKDFATALYWLGLAAERGASRPTFHLGRMYEEGWGVPVDSKKAGQLYQKAADRGEWFAHPRSVEYMWARKKQILISLSFRPSKYRGSQAPGSLSAVQGCNLQLVARPC